MLRHKQLTPVFFLLLGSMLIAAIFIYDQASSSRAQQTAVQERDAKLPVVDFDAPESSDKEKRERRRKKGRKYDKADLPVNPSPEVRTTTSVSHWFYGMPSLPILQRDVIVLGEVADANAFLSPDKTGVYSEYTVRIDQVLKTDDAALTPSQTIDAQRPGGRVRLSTGLVQSYKILNQGVPRIGGKYVLFLKRVEYDLLILTGYELRQNKVKAIDKVGLFNNYSDVDSQSFMHTLQEALVSPQATRSVEYYMSIEPIEPPDPEPSPACAAPTPGACTTPQTNDPVGNLLKPNQQYTVTIDPTGFTPEKIAAIKRGFETWNDLNAPTATSGTNNGVTFGGFTETTTPPDSLCNYCIHVRGANDVHDLFGNPAAATTAWQAAGTTYPYITTAMITIAFNVPVTAQSAVGCPTGQTWSYNILQPMVEHEIGHPQGLKDCYPSCTGSSIMGASDPKVQAPTPCDIQAVKSKYAPPSGGGGGGGDTGGGGNDTPCTDHWGVWGVYNDEGDLIGYEWEYEGCF
jgi:hypothetical protein